MLRLARGQPSYWTSRIEQLVQFSSVAILPRALGAPRLADKYCRAGGLKPDSLGGRETGIHSLRKTAITDAISNGAQMHEVDQRVSAAR